MTRLGYVDTLTMTRTAAGTIKENARVKLDANGDVVEAGAEIGIGYAQRAAVTGDVIAVRLMNAPSWIALANAAISIGDEVEAAAAGRIATFSVGVKQGMAVTAATAQDDEVLVVPIL